MNNEIQFQLKNAENYDEFFMNANIMIAEEMAEARNTTVDDLLTDEIESRAREYWDEYQSAHFPF